MSEGDHGDRAALDLAYQGQNFAKYIVFGVIKILPLLGPLACRLRNVTVPDESSRYCYSVWLRHLVKAKENDLIDSPPPTVLELGPGSSLGAGLAALLSGTTRLYSFDAVHAAKMSIVLKVFDELVGLFRDRESIPDNNEFPEIFLPVETCDFPRDVLSDDVLEESLSPKTRCANPGFHIVEPRVFSCSQDLLVQLRHPRTVRRHDFLPGGIGACRRLADFISSDELLVEAGGLRFPYHRLS